MLSESSVIYKIRNPIESVPMGPYLFNGIWTPYRIWTSLAH